MVIKVSVRLGTVEGPVSDHPQSPSDFRLFEADLDHWDPSARGDVTGRPRRVPHPAPIRRGCVSTLYLVLIAPELAYASCSDTPGLVAKS